MSSSLTQEREQLKRISARITAQRRRCRVPALVLLTDDDRIVDWVEAVTSLPKGSAVIVRAREPRPRETLARAIDKVAKPRRIKILIADDPKLAIRIRGSGFHAPERKASNLPGFRRSAPHALITISAHGAKGATAARQHGIDAILLSPIFPTQSHKGSTALGPVRWSFAAKISHKPTFALGGVSTGNALSACAAGASGLAIIGAWTTRS